MSLARALVLLCFASSAAAAQQPPAPPEPTPEHKILAQDAGTWDATIRTFYDGPDSEPQVTRGQETNEVVPGGLWVLSRFDGSFGPAMFQGRGQFGYDPAKKKYVGTWLDSMTPALTVLEGSYDAKTRTMSYTGEGYDAEHKAKYTQRMVTQTRDDGTRRFTLYMKFEGQPAEAKFMEIDYTRRR